ncbi:MAG: DUF2637 domain-containing protein [Actinophytocola sp.]|nr:DUF2637 domain-containing protein [Actinophytocola sp.]
MNPRRDIWMWIGIGTVALAAAVMSFDALRRLAVRAGVVAELAWLLPLAIDAAVVVATRAWLIGYTSARVTSYARSLAVASLGLSVAGNATEHGMAAYTITTPWWVVVAVSAVPPAMLGAIAHLAALAAADRDTATEAVAPQPAATAPAMRHTESAPTRPTSKPVVVKRPALPAGGKAALMRATFDRYRAEGRLDELTGAELARSANATPSVGRRYLAQWRAETDEPTENEQAA